MSEKKFIKKLRQRFDKVQIKLKQASGEMGDGQGNLYVPNRPNHIYVTVNNAAFPVYYNPNRITPKVGVKVWVGYSHEEPNLYQVLSTRSNEPDNVSHLDRLRASRFTDIRDLTFLRIGMSPLGGSYIDLEKGRIWSGTELIAVARQNVDLSAHVPEVFGRAAFVLITIDTAGAVVQTKGDETQLHELDDTYIPDPPAGTAYVSGAVRVYYGQTQILEAKTNTDFVDLRLVNYLMNVPAEIDAHIADTSDAHDASAISILDAGAYFTGTTVESALQELGAGGSGGGGGGVTFHVTGALSIADDVAPAIIVTSTTYIGEWYFYLGNRGSSGDSIFDIILNGVDSIFDDGLTDNRPVIAYDDVDGWVKVEALITDFVEGDILTLNVDQVATDASDLSVTSSLVNEGLTVRDSSSSVLVSPTTKIVVPDGALTDNGGGEVAVEIPPSMTIEDESATVSVSSPIKIVVTDGTLVDAGGGVVQLETGGGGGGSGSDPFGIGAPFTLAMLQRRTPRVMGANQGRWARVVGSGDIDAIGIDIGTSSGNICVAVYRKTGVGRDARPGTLLATSGSVASPGTGYREISLGSTVSVEPGDFFFLSTDSATVSFYVASEGNATVRAHGLGFTMYAASAHPAPASNPTITDGLDGWTIGMVGILA